MTRKILFSALMLLLTSNITFAQKGYDPADVKAKAEKSNNEVTDAKASSNYKIWLKRADIFGEIAESPLAGAYLNMGQAEAELLLGKANTTSEIQVGGKPLTKFEYPCIDLFFENGKLLYWTIKDSGVENPLETGYLAIEKAYSIDPSKSTKKVKEALVTYKNYFIKTANNAYGAGNKAEAAKYFALGFQSSAHAAVNTPDTLIAYFAAFASLEASNYSEAAKYGQIAISNRCYQNGDTYKLLGEAYSALKEVEKSKECYLKGLEMFPANTANIFGIINLHLSQNEDPKNVIPYLDKAIQLDPQNPSLYLIKGSFYEKFKDYEQALIWYKKSVAINSKYFEGWNNVGVTYYNQALELVNKSNSVDVNNKQEYEKLLKDADAKLKMSLEQFLVAYNINPKDKNLVENIKNIYFRFRNESEDMKKKYEEFNAIFQSM
jgi:tetratricopeptide (TPR) repeat protein